MAEWKDGWRDGRNHEKTDGIVERIGKENWKKKRDQVKTEANIDRLRKCRRKKIKSNYRRIGETRLETWETRKKKWMEATITMFSLVFYWRSRKISIFRWIFFPFLVFFWWRVLFFLIFLVRDSPAAIPLEPPVEVPELILSRFSKFDSIAFLSCAFLRQEDGFPRLPFVVVVIVVVVVVVVVFVVVINVIALVVVVIVVVVCVFATLVRWVAWRFGAQFAENKWF